MTDFVTNFNNISVPALGQTLALASSTGLTTLTFVTTQVAGTTGAAVSGFQQVNGAVGKSYVGKVDGAVSAGAFTMQGSNDLVNWFDTGSAVSAIVAAAGTTASLATDTQPWKYIRARVSTTLVGAGNLQVFVAV